MDLSERSDLSLPGTLHRSASNSLLNKHPVLRKEELQNSTVRFRVGIVAQKGLDKADVG